MSASDPRRTESAEAETAERHYALELLTDDGEEWTAVPETSADRERLTRWITVDESALLDLEEWR